MWFCRLVICFYFSAWDFSGCLTSIIFVVIFCTKIRRQNFCSFYTINKKKGVFCKISFFFFFLTLSLSQSPKCQRLPASTQSNIFLSMEPEIKHYTTSQFHVSKRGMKVSLDNLIYADRLVQNGKNGKIVFMEKVVIRSDLQQISLGKYVIFQKNSVIRPSYKLFSS